jgi:hypothetical protein
MSARTVSEHAFEEYLSKRRITARYEELPEGLTRPVDYSFDFEGVTIRCDVKEWAPRQPLPGLGTLDPYARIRDKIGEGKRKFKQYKGRGEPCLLALCHYGPQLIVLDHFAILGAMRGNIGWAVPLDTKTGIGDTSRLDFLSGGRMFQHGRDGSVRSLNTTISAIAVVTSIRVRERRVAIQERQQRAAGRQLTIDEFRELYVKDASPEEEIRLIVYDNLDAAVSLPRGFPNGPYDERFGRDGEHLSRIFIGSDIASIEHAENSVGIQRRDGFRLLGSP